MPARALMRARVRGGPAPDDKRAFLADPPLAIAMRGGRSGAQVSAPHDARIAGLREHAVGPSPLRGQSRASRPVRRA